MIYVNGRFLLQNLTGVNRFAYELCLAWVEMGVDFTICCPPGMVKSCYDVSRFSIVTCGWGKSHVWEQLSLPLWFARMKGEKILVCFTGLGPLLIKRKVMTIHDLAFMANPSWYSRPYTAWYKLMTPLCASTSKKLITVSHFSKGEIVRRLQIDADKITVVPNAVSQAFAKPQDPNVVRQTTNEKYILAVSSIDPRKNFGMLLKAFAHVEDKAVKLYIIGGQDAIYATSMDKLQASNKSDRVKWLGRVSDEELHRYYAGALCFVYPSLYEGFGIPPLEAMACGTPTIVADIPVLREVCGGASVYANPLDEIDIAGKINQVVADEDLRHRLVQQGRVRWTEFNWQRSARVLTDMIEECV